MPKEFSRSRRVGELVQRELAGIIQRHSDSIQYGMITISAIDISPDIKNAKIFFTCLENNPEITDVEELLNNYAGQFRHELSKSLSLRVIPKLRFEFDHSLERANRLSELIDSLNKDAVSKNKS